MLAVVVVSDQVVSPVQTCELALLMTTSCLQYNVVNRFRVSVDGVLDSLDADGNLHLRKFRLLHKVPFGVAGSSVLWLCPPALPHPQTAPWVNRCTASSLATGSTCPIFCMTSSSSVLSH